MPVTSREDLKQYALRRLGAPVLEINVDDQQLEDRLDDALGMYRTYHFDGIEKVFVKHQITASVMTFAGVSTGTFAPGERVTGGTSGATATAFLEATNSLSLKFRGILGTFANGETVTGSISGATAVLAASNAVELGDVDNKYITIPDGILSVVRLLPTRASGTSLFDVRYQMAINSIGDVAHMDIVSYEMSMTHLELINQMFNGEKPLRFNRYQNKLSIDFDWGSNAIINEYIVIECHKAIDPETAVGIYSDFWLQDYTTALFQKQWGMNMIKFSGITLPGGVTLNAQATIDAANASIKELEEKLRKEFQEPCDFFMG